VNAGLLARLVGGLAIVAVAALGARAASAPMTTGAAVGVLVIALVLGAERAASRARIERLTWGAVGGIVGLAAGTVLGHAVGDVLPSVGPITPALGSAAGLYLGVLVGARRGPDFTALNARLFAPPTADRGMTLLDTSAIIDARIADLAATGFIEGPLVVPQFVLRELQHIADSSDPRRRARGKRGFEVVQRLQRLPGPLLEIREIDVPGVTAVDQKLLEVAKARSAKVVTTDYNLNRLAEVNGVVVLNVNALANALKSALVAGEDLRVHLVREGKEVGQGIGYLDDGTMVVVDQGKRWIGRNVDVVVTSVLQTPAGRIIFTRLRDEEPLRA
jgi:uncharacterized protein YacL